jgi:putative endonuclease
VPEAQPKLRRRSFSPSGPHPDPFNYLCRTGEIDLVLRDGPSIVFVEVRLRTNSSFGGAAESIGPRKRARIIAAAQHYLAGKPEVPCRFDVVLLDRLEPPRIEWIRDAFSA